MLKPEASPPDEYPGASHARADLDRIRQCTCTNSKDAFRAVKVCTCARVLPTAARMQDRIDVQAQYPFPPPSTNESGDFAAITAITRLVQLSSRYAWPVIVGVLLAAIVCASYFTRHVVITTDTNQLMSSSLPWRQQERAIDLAFPQRVSRIVVVIDAPTPEAAVNAADALVNELSPRSDVIRSISRFQGGEFFERNGILFRSLDEVRRDTSEDRK